MAKKTSRGPHVDKYQKEADVAQAGRKDLDRVWVPRQRELDHLNRGARLLDSALVDSEKVRYCRYCEKTEAQCKGDSNGVGCVYMQTCGEYHRPWDTTSPDDYIVPEDEERYTLI